MNEEEERNNEQAEAQNELCNAVLTLIDEFGWTLNEVIKEVESCAP